MLLARTLPSLSPEPYLLFVLNEVLGVIPRDLSTEAMEDSNAACEEDNAAAEDDSAARAAVRIERSPASPQ